MMSKTVQDMLTEHSGCRYRIRAFEQIWWPSDLLASLLESETGRAILNQRYELRDESNEYTTMWQIWYILEENIPQTCRCCEHHLENKRQIGYEQSPYVLEDLLDLYRVLHWLEQQPADRIMASFCRDGESVKSTLIKQYYSEALGIVQSSLLDEIRRPLWALYLDGLMSGLLPQGRAHSEVQIRAETLCIWLSCICAIHEDAGENYLNDEES